MLKLQKLPGCRIGSDWRFDLETIKQWQLDQMEAVS
jgi:hypothetical protein